MPEKIENIEGTLHYERNQAYLIETNKNSGQTTSLLTFDVPPLGAYSPEEAAAAYGYLLHINAIEETKLKIIGFRLRIITQDIIRIVRFA